MAKETIQQTGERPLETADQPKKPKAAPRRATKKTSTALADTKLQRPLYDGVDSAGLPMQREARTIGELPLADQAAALQDLTQALAKELGLTAVKCIHAGTPVFAAFKDMHRQRAKNHLQAKLLLSDGAAVALDRVSIYLP